MTADAAVQKKTVRFRARSFVAFSLAPEAPLADWLDGLDRWIENSPGFFVGRPVVLDLGGLTLGDGELKQLVCDLAARAIRIYAIEGHGGAEIGPDLPPLLVGTKPAKAAEPAPEAEAQAMPDASESIGAEAAETLAPGSIIIRSPIRSGQSIYQPHGDVIVLGSVGSGSEIIAGGSVHVYGTLRGRVFAGAAGNPDARIFCRRNEAELLAVDGYYQTADAMEPSSRGKPIQAFLENGVIQVAALN